jgi:hypothetical protein
VNDFIIAFKQQKEYPRFRPVWKLIDASIALGSETATAAFSISLR